MEEIWKPITSVNVKTPDGRYRYEVSNLGRVRSVAHQLKSGLDSPEKIMKVSRDGIINFSIRGSGTFGVAVSRLVAEAFVPNPNWYSFISYKDGDAGNWNANNLVWCESRAASQGGRPVLRCNANGDVVERYTSVNNAVTRTGFAESAIRACIRNPRRTTGGDFWKWDTEAEVSPVCRSKKKDIKVEDVSTKGAIETRQYTKDGVLVKVWPSAKAAAAALGVSASSISGVCSPKYKHRKCLGYFWRKATDDEFGEKVGLSPVAAPKVRQYGEDGSFIAEFDTPLEAFRETGINNSSISYACRSDKLVKCGGFFWRYSDNDEFRVQA